MLASLFIIFIFIFLPLLVLFAKGNNDTEKKAGTRTWEAQSPSSKEPEKIIISTSTNADTSYTNIISNESSTSTKTVQGKRDFAHEKRKECKFLGEGIFNVCGHILVDPFIYVTDKCDSLDEEYAINLNHTEHLILASENPEETIIEIEESSMEKANLFFFKPIQTDYFLTWLEKYYDMSVLPEHCFSRWMGGLYKRAIIDNKDCVLVCKKMLRFALRYYCSYYMYNLRLNILQYVTAIANNIDTEKLSVADKAEFRELLDKVIAPLAFFHFKAGWKWDPAYLYDKLTGSTEMTLFQSCMVWLARHDDERFDFWVSSNGGYYEHGFNQFSCLLFAMKKVCDAIEDHKKLIVTPIAEHLINIENDPMLLDFPILKYTYFQYNYGELFSSSELSSLYKEFFEFASQGRFASTLFRSTDFHITDIDGVARNFFNLPSFSMKNMDT